MKKFLLLFFLLSLPFAFALGPTTSPMRFEGEYNLGGSFAPTGVELNGYVNDTLTKTFLSSGSGFYSLTVAGLDGQTVVLSVGGITVGTFTFDSFAVETFDIDLTLQSNGIFGCTQDDVCSGGTCVNPTGVGVCS